MDHTTEKKKRKNTLQIMNTTPGDKNQKVYRPSTIGPRVLPGHSLLSLLIFKVYFKHLCKILAQTMRSCTLDTTSSVGNKCLVQTQEFEKRNDSD
jgi:hypothetical protein